MCKIKIEDTRLAFIGHRPAACLNNYPIKRHTYQGAMADPDGPRSKRQKCDGGETPSAFVLGGPMYDEETACKILREARVRPGDGEDVLYYENEEEAATGFDPRDLDNVYHSVDDYGEFTPMFFYANKGDLKMCRYLLSRGASTTRLDGDNFSPMHAAAIKGRFDLGKLLYANGAKDHVRLKNKYSWTPFLYTALYGYDDFVKWLVLHGALCRDDNSDEVDGDLIHYGRTGSANDRIYAACRRLVDWSRDVLQEHSSMVTFLLGTLPLIPDSGRTCILESLNGHPGIRKLIGDFVGLEVTKAKQLRILRSVVKVLPETMRNGRKDDRYWVGPAR